MLWDLDMFLPANMQSKLMTDKDCKSTIAEVGSVVSTLQVSSDELS